MLNESQDIEYKESWSDKYLQWVCGFANAQGGRIYIGVNDDKEIVGVHDAKRLMEDIPNKIANSLGIVEDINLLTENGKEYIEIVVSPSSIPIAYHGVYHYRSGSTKQELKGIALQQFIMRKMGHSWDDMPLPSATLKEIDRSAIDYFLRRGISKHRIDPSERGASTEDVLRNMNLIGDDGYLRTAAILLFGKNPQRRFAGVQFKIGRFGANESDLIIQDVVEGNVIQMVDRVVEILKSKYLYSPIHYEGMERVEPLEIPEDGLREILYNSVCHKDYMGAPIQMQVYADHVEIWNEGGLPQGYTPETLMRKHSSRPRNKTIAAVMFRAGFIETWGRGYTKVRESFEADRYPIPEVTEIDGGVSVWIKRFSLNELAERNKKRYGNKAPNLQGTLTRDAGADVSAGTGKYPENGESTLKEYPVNGESTTEVYPVNGESTTEKYPVNGESTTEKYPVNGLDGKGLGKTALRILELIERNPKATREQMAQSVGISLEGVKKQVKRLRDMGLVVREGSDKSGYWRIITSD